MSTTVVSVRGLSPEAWLADTQNVYVGRRVFLRSGKHAGQLWPMSLWMNPFRLPWGATREQQVECVVKYVNWFIAPEQARLHHELDGLRGQRLGCWCGAWNGATKPCRLLCHAVPLAILADHWRPGLTAAELVAEWMGLEISKGTSCENLR